MKVLFLIEGWISPAPRYRVLQYLPFLATAGVSYKVRALHGDSHPACLGWPILGPVCKLLIRSRRLYHIRDAHQFDVVFLQRLTLPFSDLPERILAKKNPRLIFDFDDAIYQTESGESPVRKRVFDRVVARATEVIAGSDYLAERAGSKAIVIPTVIDTLPYHPKPYARRRNKLIIGWIGTYSNYPNFQPILPILKRILKDHPSVEFHLVSDRPPPFSLPKMTYFPWDKNREIADLQSFHIGIMPLLDTSWNRGKCAFKLIQYMAVGIPVVAGAVGANKEVVQEGITGHLADSPEAWERALKRLIEDESSRQKLGRAGRERCLQHYSLKSQQMRLLESLKRVAQAP